MGAGLVLPKSGYILINPNDLCKPRREINKKSATAIKYVLLKYNTSCYNEIIPGSKIESGVIVGRFRITPGLTI